MDVIRLSINQGITSLALLFYSKQRNFKMIVAFSIITLSYFFAYVSSACSTSDTDTNAFSRVQNSYLTTTLPFIYAVKTGTVSTNIYYLEWVFTPNNMFVRKTDASNNLLWYSSYGAVPNTESLAIDPSESSIYYCLFQDPLDVLKLSTSSGALSSTTRFSNLKGQDFNVRTWILSDNSGYFVVAFNSASSKDNICRYLFASPSSVSCYETSNLNGNTNNQMKLSDSQLFFISLDNSSPTNLHMCKVTFGSPSADWAKKITCPTSSCNSDCGETLMSSDGSIMYTFFLYGDTAAMYAHFVSLNPSSGEVIGTRYITSTTASFIDATILIDNYLAVSLRCPDSTLAVLNLSSSSFVYMKISSGNYILGLGKDPNYSRAIAVGLKSSNAYISRFYLQSVTSHPDLSASTLTMNVYTTGNYDFVSDVGPTISISSAPTTVTNPAAYPNASFTFQSSSADSFSLQVNSSTDSYPNLLENSYVEVSPTLTCSSLSSTTIVYSISNYNGITAPSWVAIVPSSGLLKISTPNVTSSISCSFYIDAQISSVTNPVQKLINLKVTKCLAQNCQKCTTSDSSKCSSCNSNYYLSNGYCSNEATSTIKTLSTTTNSIIAGTAALVILTSTVHSASFASLWAIINQLQLFLMLILTRVFLPLDVINFIIGSKIAMFPYDYIPFKKSSYSGSINDLFDNEQNDEILSKIGLDSASSFVNNYSLFSSLLSVVLLHLSVFVAMLLLSKCEVEGKCAKPFKALRWLTQKVFLILTFGYYIRTVIESYQFLLVSSVSEINSFNVKSSSHISSLVVAFLILIVCLVFAIISFVLTSASNPKSNNEHNKLGELYVGLKNTVFARFYLALQLLRRIIFVSLLITLAPISSIAIAWAISCLQIVYLIVLIILRPFEELKDNLIEIINEVFFSYFTCWLTHFNSESVWSSTTTDIYLTLLCSNNFIIFLIVLIATCIIMAKKAREKCCTPKTIEPKIRQNAEETKSEMRIVKKDWS